MVQFSKRRPSFCDYPCSGHCKSSKLASFGVIYQKTTCFYEVELQVSRWPYVLHEHMKSF